MEKESIKRLIAYKLIDSMKKNHVYHFFRSNCVKPNVYHMIRMAVSDRKEVNVTSSDELIHYICRKYNDRIETDNEKEFQMMVMKIINDFIHDNLERPKGMFFDKLSAIGQQAFNSVCEKIYGEGFEDKTAMAEIGADKDMTEKFNKMLEELLKGCNTATTAYATRPIFYYDWTRENDNDLYYQF